MQAPKKARDLEEARRKAREEKAAHTVGLVWPDGHVTTHLCPPPGEGEDDGIKTGDTPVRWVNGEPSVWKPYRARGCKMLKEVCADDGIPELYEQWHAIVTAMIMRPGIPVRGNVTDVYPPTVKRLRESIAAGGMGDGQAFVIGTGITADPEVKTEKLVGQLVSAGLPAPSTEQLAAAKKTAKEVEVRA